MTDTLIQNRVENGKIYQQKDYNLFNLIEANRDINKMNLAKIIRNYNDGINLFPYKPILVDANFMIYDGQHRYEACKALGLPIYYMLIKPQDLTGLIKLNNAQKTWSQSNYLDSFVAQKMPHYMYLKEFLSRHKISITPGVEFLTQTSYSKEIFTTGRFTCGNKTKAEFIAKIHADLITIAPKLKGKTFQRACIDLASAKGYDHELMQTKLPRHRDKVVHYNKKPDMMRQLEHIMNYNNRGEHIRLF